MPIIEGPQVTINLGSFWHWLIGGTLTINIGLLARIIWFIARYYRRYKNAFMMFIEEHEELVADYNRRHPGQQIYFGGKKSKLHVTSSRNKPFRREHINPDDESSAD